MAYYKPCKNCAVEKATCARRSALANAVAGLSVTSINFRCSDRSPLFETGQRVSFRWTSWEVDDWGNSDSLGLIYHGTVIQEHGLRFIVRVDDGPSADDEKIEARDTFKNGDLVIKVKPSDMLALDEAPRKLCPSCAGYDGETERCHAWHDGYVGYSPNGCLSGGERGEAA